MSFGKLAGLGERLTQRRSTELTAKVNDTPRTEHGDDYVLVDESSQDMESNQVESEEKGRYCSFQD